MRILNVTLNEEIKIILSLTQIYGIGLKRSKHILDLLNINYTTTLKELEDEKKEKLKILLLSKEKTIGTYLKRSISTNFKNQIILNTFRGSRYKTKMPVRGQRSRTNNKTNKKRKQIQFEI